MGTEGNEGKRVISIGKRSLIEIELVMVAGSIIFSVLVSVYSAYSGILSEFRNLALYMMAVDSKIVGKSPDGWHRRQMQEWCRLTEEENRELGFRCPDIDAIPGPAPRRLSPLEEKAIRDLRNAAGLEG